MDPLSVAASIAGLLTASVEVAKLFGAFIAAYDYARTVHDEIHHFRFILFRLDKYIHSNSLNVARASMIDLDQVVTVLVGCMCTFSELEREIKRLQSRSESLRRMWWTMAKSSLVDLVQRLQNHKGTICSMLIILTSESQDVALNGMNELRSEVAELLRINADMARKLGLVTAGSALSSGASMNGSVMTRRSVLSFSSARTDFQTSLNKSRVYRRALLDRVNKPRPATEQSSASSIKQSWSVLSGLSLSEISNYSAYSLPISPNELYNPTWYKQLRHDIPLDSNMPEVPNLLTIGYAESLKIALKQNDVEASKALSSYVTWNIALKMSAVYPMLATGPSDSLVKELDRLTLFKSWLQCGGDTKTRIEGCQTAIDSAIKDEDWGLFKVLVQNGSDVDSRFLSKTALDLVSGTGGEKFVHELYEDNEVQDKSGVLAVFNLGYKRVRAVKVLLKLGANINAQDDQWQTALHHASQCGNQEVTEVLLGHGANISAKNRSGMTALHCASKGGRERVVGVLLSHGADVNAKDEWEKTALHWASGSGLGSVVDALLSHGADVNAKGGWGKTALHWASEGGYESVVKALLSHGADVNAKGGWGKTALHWASEGGYESVVKALLSHGADVNAKGELEKTALHWASEGGHESIVEALLSYGADVNAKDKSEMTALQRASIRGHESVIKALLSHGADFNAKDESEKTALHWASRWGLGSVVETLLSHGADANTKDKSEKTALHWASEGGHESVVKALLSRGADVNAKGELEKTALHWASEGGHESIVEALLSHGADVNAKDKSEMTALQRASIRGHESVIKALLSHGADFNAKDESGKTALHWASRWGLGSVVEALLSHGADVNAKGEWEKTALHWASEGGHEPVVKALLSHGADVNAKDESEKTALHWASEWGRVSVVEALLSHGADVNAKDELMTALDYAAKGKHNGVTRVLQRHGART